MRSMTVFFIEGHVIFCNTRQNLWLLSSFCAHKGSRIDKREGRRRKVSPTSQIRAPCSTAYHRRADYRADGHFGPLETQLAVIFIVVFMVNRSVVWAVKCPSVFPKDDVLKCLVLSTKIFSLLSQRRKESRKYSL